MAHRKAASVLPEPVGARTRVCSPRLIAGQPWAWGGVASGKLLVNHSATAGVNVAAASNPGGAAVLAGRRRAMGSTIRRGCDGDAGLRAPNRPRTRLPAREEALGPED